MSRGRVCLYVPYLYPVLRGGSAPFAGGAEVQQAHLAHGLVTAGFDVSIVTCDFGQPAVETIDGIRILRAFKPHAGLPIVRFLHPRLTLATRALWSADADVYFVQGAGQPAGLAYDVARWRHRKFVFLAAHDHDTLRNLPELPLARDRAWYVRALRGADRVLAQTEFQRALLRQNFGVASEVVTNPVAIPPRAFDPAEGRNIVWLATYKASKRPEWFTALARRLPEHHFVMHGVIPIPPLTTESYDAALAAARECPNLEVLGFLDRDRLADLFSRAALFVHTSPAEGFPNTFLEAWAHGIPTVTAFDPDGVIAREGLGEKLDSLDAMTESVRAWMADPERRRAAGARARRHVELHHAPERVITQLARVLDDVQAR
jgi:glycosyltransferase involved in cell wall biosynthesis